MGSKWEKEPIEREPPGADRAPDYRDLLLLRSDPIVAPHIVLLFALISRLFIDELPLFFGA